MQEQRAPNQNSKKKKEFKKLEKFKRPLGPHQAYNIRIIKVPEEEEGEQEVENLFEEIMMENFPNPVR